jgi:hypothetical protein
MVRRAFTVLFVLALAMAACGDGDQPVSDASMQLTFDGDACTYEGPTPLRAGPAALVFRNTSDGRAGVNLLRHRGDETIQDAIDYLGEQPSSKHGDSWMEEVGTWRGTLPGESHTWEGNLKPGSHSMVCASITRTAFGTEPG